MVSILFAVLLIVVAIGLFFAFALSILPVALMLAVAGVVGWLADRLVPGNLPGGRLGAILAGLVGSWVGVWLFGIAGLKDVGPTIFDVPIIPALVGAIVLAFLVDVIAKRRT